MIIPLKSIEQFYIYIYTANNPRRHQMLFQLPLYLFEDAILSSHGFQPLPGLAGAAHLWVSEKTESWLPKPPTCPETGFSVGNFPPKNERIKTRGVGRPSVGLWSMSVSRSFLGIDYTFLQRICLNSLFENCTYKEGDEVQEML